MGAERGVKYGTYKLNRRQEAFCHEYLVDFCGSQAAARAGYKQSTRANLARKAHELLNNERIKERLSVLTAERFRAVDIKTEQVLEEISKVAFINIKNFLDDNGNILPVDQISETDFAAVAEITERRIGSKDDPIVEKKYKLADKLKALEMLGRYLKLFTDKTEHSVDTGLASILKDIDGDSTGLPSK